MPAAPAPLQTSRVCLDVAAGQPHRVDHAGGGDDRGAVLVVVEDRNVHQLAQALLDDEALRRLDVLEVDAAERGAEVFDGVDEFFRVLGVDLEVDGVDVGEALEQHRLAFHHRLGGQRAEIAEAQNRRAVGDDGDHVAARGVVVGGRGVGGDRLHGHGDAGRIGEREIALRRHRLGGDDLQLARPAARVEQQRLLVGDRRARRASLRWFGHVCSSVLASKGRVGGYEKTTDAARRDWVTRAEARARLRSGSLPVPKRFHVAVASDLKARAAGLPFSQWLAPGRLGRPLTRLFTPEIWVA